MDIDQSVGLPEPFVFVDVKKKSSKARPRKLTANLKAEIKRDIADGVKLKDIAIKYAIPYNTIHYNYKKGNFA